MNVTFATIVTRIVFDQDEKRAFIPETFTKDPFPRNMKDYNGTMKDFFDALTGSYIPIGMIRKNYILQIFNLYSSVRTLTDDEINLPVKEFIQRVWPTYMIPGRTNFTFMVTLAARLPLTH